MVREGLLIRRYLRRHLSRPEAIWANTFQVEKTSAKDQPRARSQHGGCYRRRRQYQTISKRGQEADPEGLYQH